jgi:hypothetical protein
VNLTPEEQAQLLRDMMTGPAVFAEAQAAMQRFYESHSFVFDDDDVDAVDVAPEELLQEEEAAASPAANPSLRRRTVDPELRPVECYRRRDQSPAASDSGPPRSPNVWAERVENMGIWVRNGRSSHPAFHGALAHGPVTLYPGDPGWDHWNAELAGNDVLTGGEPPPIERFRKA